MRSDTKLFRLFSSFRLLFLTILILTVAGHACADYNVFISSTASSNGSWSGTAPDVWTPDATGAKVAAAEVQSRLSAGTSVVITTVGAGAENGDISVESSLSWSTSTTLTFSALRNITVKSNISATGASAGLIIVPNNTGSGGSFTLSNGAVITLSGASPVLSIGGNPYTVINNASALQNMANDLSGRYALGSNIDAAATSGWNAGAGFMPVGTVANPFVGTVDGLNHKISNLLINRPSMNNGVGLIGVNGGSIVNIGFVGGSVAGHDKVGCLVGLNSSGTISNTYSTCSVSSSDVYVGGLAGHNSGSVLNSFSTGSVSGFSELGGLVGYNTGTISGSYSTGAVSGTNRVGGLVGYNAGGTIANSYSTGNSSGFNRGGGLVAENTGIITNSYSTGSVNGFTFYAGGLVGKHSGGSVTNSYWDTQTSGQAGSSAGSGLTTNQMNSAANFTGFDFINTWWVSEGNTRPFLRSEYSIEINNSHQLQLMGMNAATLAVGYTLGVDISMAELANSKSMWNTATGFVPVGDNVTPFTGAFDGLRHTINRLIINRPSTSFVGLFGYTGTGSAIRNVGLTDVNVTGSKYVGSLTGINSAGLISNSYSVGSVTGTGDGYSEIGGLVGENSSSGSITNCYTAGNVTGTGGGYAIGGLVGINYESIINNSYSTSTVSGSANDVGGLVGNTYLSGTISNSYSSGSVSGGGSYIGALVGWNNNQHTVSSCFSSSSVNGGTGGLIGNGAGIITNSSLLSAAQMMSQSNFSGWDFSSTWRLYAGHTYPLLRSLLTPLAITADNVNKEFDGNAYTNPLQNPVYSVSGAGTSALLFNTPNPYNSATAVGTYAPDIYSSQLGYDISFVNGTLTIVDSTPDPFGFTPVSNAQTSTAYESDSVLFAGYDSAASVSISLGHYYSISSNSGATWSAWTSSVGTISPGDRVKVMLVSSPLANTVSTVVLSIGGVSGEFTVTTATTPVSTFLPQNGLLSLWRAENNSLDSIGSNHGILQGGATYAPGKSGQAFSFDGIDDFARFPDSSAWDFGGGSFSISLWVKFNSLAPGYNALLDQMYDERAWSVFYYPGSLGFAYSTNGSTPIEVRQPWTPSTGTWYHIALIRDGNILRHYVDGTQIGADHDLTGVTIFNSSKELWLGSAHTGAGGNTPGLFTNGQFDDIAVYNRALSLSEVALINGKIPAAGLVSLWSAEGNSNDSIGSNHGSLLGGGVYAAGKLGQAFSLDGSTGYVEKTSPDESLNIRNQSWTISAWVKSSSTDAVPQMIVSRYECGWTPGCNASNVADYALMLTDAGYARFTVRGSTGDAGSAGVADSVDLRDGSWHLVTGVLDRSTSTARIYVDGQLRNTISSVDVGDVNDPGSPLEIGRTFRQVWGSPGSYFNGAIDEVAIYNRALTAAEVAQVSGIVPSAFSFLPVIDAQTSTAYESAAITVAGISSASPISVTGGHYAVSTNGGSTWSTWINTSGTVNLGDQVKVMLVSSPHASTLTSATLTIGGVSGNFDVTTSALPVPTIIPQNGLVSLWRAENNPLDSIGTNHGALVSGAAFGAGRTDQAFKLDGINDYIEIPDSPSLTLAADFSLSLWANYSAIRSGGAGNVPNAFIGQDSGGGSNPKWVFLSADDGLYFHINGSGSSWIGPVPFAPQTGNWYHLTLTRIGNLYSFYINGIPAGSVNNSAIIPDVNASLTIGQVEGLGYFNGLIDEVKIYDRQLSSQEVGLLSGMVPDQFNFAPLVSATLNTEYESAPVQIAGLTYATTVSVAGGQYAVSGDGTNWGAWNNNAGSVSPDSWVKVKTTSSGSYGTTSVSTLTIGGVSADFTVKTKNSVTGSAPRGNGSISCTSPVDELGQSICSITPDYGYHLASLTDNGTPVIGSISQSGNHTITDVTTNHEVVVGFAINIYTVTATAGANGEISPSGALSYQHGSSTSQFSVTPGNGYHILSVRKDGEDILVQNSAGFDAPPFTTIVTDHTIDAVFTVNLDPGPARIVSPQTDFQTLQDAYLSITSSGEILLLSTLPGAPAFFAAHPKTIWISGGYGSGYTPSVADFTVIGRLTVSNGKILARGVKIR